MFSTLINTLIKIKKSFFYSVQGLTYMFENELTFRLEVYYLSATCVALYFINIPAMGKIIILTTTIILICVEAINTVAESIVDKMSPEHSDFAKHTKDMGSTAVFFIWIILLIQWIFFLIPIF